MTVAVTGLNRGENPQPGAAVIQSLRREFGSKHRLIGMVYDPLESGIFAEDGPDAVYTLPYPSSGVDAFLERIDVIQKECPIDVIIPCLDAELEPIVRLRSELGIRDIRLLMPEQEAFEARNKHKLSELAIRCGVQTPSTFPVTCQEEIVSALGNLGFPLMVKGRYYGAKRVNTPAELNVQFQNLISQWGAPVLLQQIVTGEEYNLVGLCGIRGQILGWSAIKKTVLNSEGKGFGGVTIDDPKLIEMARTLMASLEWLGPFELEVIRLSDGSYSVIEINPRFPAWVDFPSMLGINLPVALINALEGNTEKLPKCPTGKLFLRHSVELCCDLESVGTLSATGSLQLHP